MYPLALAGVGLVLVFLAAAWLGQRPVMFPAPPAAGRMSPGVAEPVRLDGPAGTHQALLLPPTHGASVPFPLVIFAHGNGELADHWVGEFEPVRDRGWGVLLLEYPGYGRAPGSPSEASIRRSALAVYHWAAIDPRIDSARIVAWGRSLGGGAAAWLAGNRPVAALILESSFTSVRPLAARYLVPGWLVRDPFDNVEALREYRGPLLVLHGTADRIVPVELGRALAATVPGAVFHALPCGHNDCERPWPVILSFLAGSPERGP
jgi:fermentation-respiration switch protein FrsA (DUF1100 family)